MKKNTRLKLGAYSALAGSASFLATNVDGQIVHKNFNPDTAFTGFGSTMDIDLNSDGNPDFRLSLNGSFTSLAVSSIAIRIDQDTLQIKALNSSNGVVQSNGLPASISTSYAVGNGASWGSGTNNQVMARWYSVYIKSGTTPPTQNTSSSGYFFAQKDALMGLRVAVGAKTYYGWARVTVPADVDSAYISEMAYQSFPGVEIAAGDVGNVATQAATNVMAGDVADNSDGSDLQVGFTQASSEAGIAEYRIYVVKSAAAATFNLDSAKCVPTGNYTSVTPTGSNFLNTLGASANDVDGAAITNGVAYKVFVVSVPDGQTATSPAISGESNEVTLNVNAGIADNEKSKLQIRQTDDQVSAILDAEWIGAEARVIDVAGKVVFSKTTLNSRVDVSTQGYAPGVYVMRVIKENRVASSKFIVR